MSHLNDAKLVRDQYAREGNLRARQALYEETGGPHPHDVLWEAITALKPHDALEVGGGPGSWPSGCRRS
jgi:hypothetical protein